MTTKNKILIICPGVLLVVAAIIFFTSSRNKGATTNPQSTFEKISSESNSTFAQINDQNLYFVKDNGTVQNLNLDSLKTSDLFSANGKIEELFFSPDYTKAYVKQNSSGQYSNWYFDGKKLILANECLNVLTWKTDSTGLFFNCVSQKFEYDPNTVNSLNDATAGELDGKNVYDFKIDPPKKLFALDNQKVIILTDSPGYQSNDLLLLDLKTKETKNLTQNGFVQDAKLVNNQKIIYSIVKDNKTETYLLSLADQKSTSLPGTANDLNLITSYSSEIYFQRSVSDGAVIEKWSPQAEKQITAISQAQIATVGKIKSLLAHKNGFILICERGIYVLKADLSV